MNFRSCMLILMVALVVTSGCDRGARSFRLKGVVKKVDAGSGEVTIAHEDIPGLMPRMTMPFSLKDRALLEKLRPGDEVEGSLNVTYQRGEVKDMDLAGLTVTKAAPAAQTFPIDTPRPEGLKPGDLVPDFAVTTQEGRALRLSELRGKVVILTFIYTRCPLPEFCPAVDAKFAELARRISTVPARADRIRLLSVSFDPEHDTPEVLAAHASRRGAKPPLWTFAVAGPEELGKVAEPLGLTYVTGTREIEHNLRTVVIGPDGKLARVEPGPGWSPADLLGTAYALIPPAEDR